MTSLESYQFRNPLYWNDLGENLIFPLNTAKTANNDHFKDNIVSLLMSKHEIIIQIKRPTAAIKSSLGVVVTWTP